MLKLFLKNRTFFALLFILGTVYTASMQSFFLPDDITKWPTHPIYGHDGAPSLLLAPDILYGTNTVDGVSPELVARIRTNFADKNIEETRRLLQPLIEQEHPQAIMTAPFIWDGTHDSPDADKLYKAYEQSFLQHQDPIALFNIGVLHSTNKTAIPYFKKAQELSNNCEVKGLAAYLMGLHYYNQKKFAKSEQAYRQAAYTYNMPEALHAMDSLTFSLPLENANTSTEHLSVILEKEEEFKNHRVFPMALNRLGWVYAFVQEDIEKALPILHKAADTYNSGSASVNLGILYDYQNDHTRALEYYKKSIHNYKKELSTVATPAYQDQIKDHMTNAQCHISELYEKTDRKGKAAKYALKIAKSHCSDQSLMTTHTLRYWLLEDDVNVCEQSLSSLTAGGNLFATLLSGYACAKDHEDRACELFDSLIEKSTDTNDLIGSMAKAAKCFTLYAHDKQDQALELLKEIASHNYGAAFFLWQHYMINNNEDEMLFYQNMTQDLERNDKLYSLDMLSITPYLIHQALHVSSANQVEQEVPIKTYLSDIPRLAAFICCYRSQMYGPIVKEYLAPHSFFLRTGPDVSQIRFISQSLNLSYYLKQNVPGYICRWEKHLQPAN